MQSIKRFLSALLVFIIASAITIELGTFLYSGYPALFGVVWLVLMFIGFKIAQGILQPSN